MGRFQKGVCGRSFPVIEFMCMTYLVLWKQDIIPAVQALHNEAHQDGADQTFKPALSLGLAELLCQYASQNPPYFDDRPSLFHELDPTIVGQAVSIQQRLAISVCPKVVTNV